MVIFQQKARPVADQLSGCNFRIHFIGPAEEALIELFLRRTLVRLEKESATRSHVSKIKTDCISED